MPAISFRPEFLDALLSGDKQQTTRSIPPVPPKRPRFKKGDVLQVYNQQRKRIADKPLLRLTDEGYSKMVQLSRKSQSNYPSLPYADPPYPAHFLGRVCITEVCQITPHEMPETALTAWALADGFNSFAAAWCWFEIRYGAKWMHQPWMVVKWDGWLERYFEPYEVIR